MTLSLDRRKLLRLGFSAGLALLAFAFLGYIVWKQREALLSYPWQVRIGPALLSFAVFSLDLFWVALVWAWIMLALGGETAQKIGWCEHVRIFMISNVAKRLPGTVWYLASRAGMYRQSGVSLKRMSLASAMEAAVSVLSGILASLLFALPILLSYQISPWWLLLVLVIGLAAIHPRVLALPFRLFKVELPPYHYRQALLWTLGYFFAWVLGGLVFFLIARAMTDLPYSTLGYMIGSSALVGVLTTALFFSPSNFGLTEIGFSLLLSAVLPASVAVVYVVAARILILFYELIWALTFSALKSAPGGPPP